jgi:hypothetical protein
VYPSSRPVALRELNPNSVTGDQPDEVGAETIRDVSEDPGPVLQLDPEHPVWERLENPTVDELRRPGHERRLYRNAVFKPQPSSSNSRLYTSVLRQQGDA